MFPARHREESFARRGDLDWMATAYGLSMTIEVGIFMFLIPVNLARLVAKTLRFVR